MGMRNGVGSGKREEDVLIEDPVMDEQIFRFLAAFTADRGAEPSRTLDQDHRVDVTPPRGGAHHRDQFGQALTMRGPCDEKK
jgi:hypothetical protein